MSAVALAFGSGMALTRLGGGHPAGYGELVEDPGGLLDLPRGFQYRVLSERGSTLSNGAPVPSDHDGMAAFSGPGDTTILVRNHELRDDEARTAVEGSNPYDPAEAGGTTGILLSPERKEIESFVTSSGTRANCAGGATSWGTWLTCEEDREEDHGYVFEVDPRDPENDLSRTPILEMGYFSHEAVDIDPSTGIAYLTEDEKPESFLYRYLPTDRGPRPGALQKGGELQVLTLEERSFDPTPGQRFQVVWRTVDPGQAHEEAETKGGARFSRLEGCHFSGGAFWFSDTKGGEQRLGQVFRYLPATETLELFFESTDVNEMEAPDNVVVAPFGDLWFCEDGPDEHRVMGITPEGELYTFARNRQNDNELAGCTFAPDGKTFFVNIQEPGITFAIWGPFAPGNVRRARWMAAAPPRASMAPAISGELGEAAERHGMSLLEAAAYDRLGVSPA